MPRTGKARPGHKRSSSGIWTRTPYIGKVGGGVTIILWRSSATTLPVYPAEGAVVPQTALVVLFLALMAALVREMRPRPPRQIPHARSSARFTPMIREDQPKRLERAIAVPPPKTSRRYALAAVGAVFAAYAALLLWAHGRVPPGLNNDVAEEALRGIYLVRGHHFEVVTFAVGNSAETLYLYLVGGMIQLFGPTILSIQLVSWICALACIWLLWKLVERVTNAVPAWVPVLAGASSIWLFHYAMAGLRAIAAPVFLCAIRSSARSRGTGRRSQDRPFMWSCPRTEHLRLYIRPHIACRLFLYAAFRLARKWQEKAILLRRYGVILAGALVVSIPNIVFLAQRPKDFLSRGSYVVRGTAADLASNTIWSILFPFYYPDSYRHAIAHTFYFDPVCAGLTMTGANPIHWIVAAAMAIGLWRVRRFMDRPVMVFLLAAWVAAMLGLGFAGPSLTRLLIVWPVYLVLAVLGFGFAIDRRPWLEIPVLLLILFVGVGDGYKYASREGQSSVEYSYSFYPAATAIGETARNLEAQGQRVLCVISRNSSVVKYLTSGDSAHVAIAEFFLRMFDPSQLPLGIRSIRAFCWLKTTRHSRTSPAVFARNCGWRTTTTSTRCRCRRGNRSAVLSRC